MFGNADTQLGRVADAGHKIGDALYKIARTAEDLTKAITEAVADAKAYSPSKDYAAKVDHFAKHFREGFEEGAAEGFSESVGGSDDEEDEDEADARDDRRRRRIEWEMLAKLLEVVAICVDTDETTPTAIADALALYDLARQP